jgi:tetratricopeptide (TPR) repeat protein
MIAVVLIALLSGAPALLPAWFKDTNSHASNKRGVKAFEEKKYGDAVSAFSKQGKTPAAAFNLGTSQIAAGNREQGSATLATAIKDPQLRNDAFFNRGNSALSAKAFDYAIRDYMEALKANPRDAAAKRNLEIAIAQKRAAQHQQQQGGSKQGDKGTPTPKPAPQQPNPQAGRQQSAGDPNAEALLRSVQQQEQEELSRMHRARPDRARVGW